MKKISLVIPCYNESRTIRELLARVEAVQFPGWSKEIIVVDDCSKDSTREILAEYESRMIIVYQEKNGGKGTAVRRGIKEASGDYVIIQDADLEYDPQDIVPFIAVIDEGRADVVYGSRNLHHKERSGFLIPRLGVWFITKLVNVLYGLHLTDVWTCYKMFPRMYGDHFVAGGFEAELLFTAALAREGLRFAEVPISHSPRDLAEGKKIRYRDGFYSIALLIADKLAHVTEPVHRSAQFPKDELACPFCKRPLSWSSDVPHCAWHGKFEVDRYGRPYLVERSFLQTHTTEHESGVNWLKTYLKQFPRLYYAIWYFFCPVLMVANGPRRFLSRLPENAFIIDVGSGPERFGSSVVNIDIHPFSEVDIVASATDLPLRDASVDMAVSESVF